MKKNNYYLLGLITLFVFLQTLSYGQGANCAGATKLNANTVTNKINISGAPGAPDLTGCTSNAVVAEGWYYFTASTAYSSVVFHNTSTQTAYVYVYSGDCANLTQVSCMTVGIVSSADYMNLVSIPTTSGQNYYIRIVQADAGAAVSGRVGFFTNSTGNSAAVCKPDRVAFATGYVTSGNKTDNIMTYGHPGGFCFGNSCYIEAYASFNTSNLPTSGITINNVTFIITGQNGLSGTGGPACVTKLQNDAVNPISAAGNQIHGSASYYPGANDFYAPIYVSANQTNVCQLYTYGVTNFTNRYAQGFWGLRMPVDWGDGYSGGAKASFYGWNTDYTPFIVVNYTGSGCTTPTITTQPLSITECEDKAIKLTVAADGNPVPTYQWKKGTNNIANATNTEFSINNITLTDAASYTCVVTNTCGSVTSNAAVLTVNSKPVISFITPDKYKCLRDSVLIKVLVTGDNLTYQWYKDGNIFNGRTDSQFILPGLTQMNSGVYNCIVTNACGSTTSTNCTMSVSQPPEIKNSIENQTKCEDDSIEMIVETDAGDYKYQWILNDEPIEGATTTSYTVEKLAKKNEGVYSCSVKSNCEPIYLKPFVVTVIQKPIINIAPLIQIKDIGDSVAWFLSPGGTPPFEYQWLRNNEIITGATEDFYKINPINYSDTGVYTCIVKNLCGESTQQISTIKINKSKFKLEGTLTYANKQSSALAGVEIYLKNNEGVIIDTAITDEFGYYKFPEVMNGTYKYEYNIKIKRGGIDPIDALICNRYYISKYVFKDKFLQKAADVDVSGGINPLDALQINRFYLGTLKSFKAGIWLFEDMDIIIKNNDVIFDIRGVCVGDANGSYKF